MVALADMVQLFPDCWLTLSTIIHLCFLRSMNLRPYCIASEPHNQRHKQYPINPAQVFLSRKLLTQEIGRYNFELNYEIGRCE